MTHPENADINDNETANVVADLLKQTLQLDENFALTTDTELLGAIPELDSMAVVTVLTELEEHFDIFIDDDISAETFETFGSLVQFVNEKLSS